MVKKKLYGNANKVIFKLTKRKIADYEVLRSGTGYLLTIYMYLVFENLIILLKSKPK